MTVASDLPRMDDEALDDACVAIDWREEEEAIVEYFAEKLADNDKLEAVWKGDELWVVYNGKEHKLPLTISPKDRSVALSSLAVVLQPKYELRFLLQSAGGDTLSFLLLRRDEWGELARSHSDWLKEHFEPLKMGHDYWTKRLRRNRSRSRSVSGGLQGRS